MKHKLSYQDIQRIADRAERRAAGKDDEVIRTYVCEHCKHEIVIDPKLPLDFIPRICKQCTQQLEYKDRKPVDINEMLDKMVKVAELVAHLDAMTKQEKDKPDENS